MNTFARVAVCLLVFSFPIGVPAGADGINLSWDECGNNGGASKLFDCDTEIGANVMFASFDPPAGVDSLASVAGQIDLVVGSKLPAWWKHGASMCRGTDQIAVSADFRALSNCADPFNGQPAGGGYNFTVAAGGNPSRARIMVEHALAIEDRGPVATGTEYYAFQIRIMREKTTGPGACDGCLEPACIVLNSIDLFQSNGPTISLFQQLDRNWITWQAPTVTDCPQNTPVRSSTWGRVKSLYR